MKKTTIKKPLPVEWSKNLTIYEVNLRQYSYGGTFKEFELHLPRLKELGVGILWFMPIQPIGKKKRKGSLGSYYSLQNYVEVNSEHGTLDEFKELVKKIHEMGMFVLLDWVANHTSWDHIWTKNRPDFFTQDKNGNFKPPVAEWEDVIELNYENRELRKQMLDSMKFWLEETDIDGFRCDMAHLVVKDFWDNARQELDKIKPVFMLAESEDRNLLKMAFDMIYNWNIHHITNKIAKGTMNVYDIDDMLAHEIHDFPQNSYQMLFTSNHDENSWNGSAIQRLTYGLEVFNVLMFTLNGMPLIYSGQEAGNYRQLDFFEKDPIEWKKDKMTDFYKILIELKRQNKALWNGPYGGDFIRIHTSQGDSVFSFIRKKDKNQVVAILNFSEKEQVISSDWDFLTGEYINVFTKGKVIFTPKANLRLEPFGYRIFCK
jgi:glycosidase